jgi:hypothetical protein
LIGHVGVAVIGDSMLPRKVLAVLAATVGALVVATGCDGTGTAPRKEQTHSDAPAFEDLTGRQMAAATAAQLKKVSSVRLNGSGTYDGDTVWMDLSVDKHHTCVGIYRIRGSRFDFVHAKDGRWFFRGDARYWSQFGPRKHKSAAVARFSDRWLLVSEKDAGRDLRDVCDLAWIWEQVIPDDVGGCVKGRTIGVSGPTVELWCDDTHVWVQARGRHLPSRYKAPAGEDVDDVTLDDYDRPVTPSLPPDDEIIDLTDSDEV